MGLERILVVHNFYQHAGGEDQVFRSEVALLRSRNHDVIEYTAHNDALEHWGKLELARKIFWNPNAYDDIRQLIQQHKPQIMHVHNTFPQLSPSIYYAAEAEGVPVVQTLHNYRLSCLNALFLRNNRPCEDCLGKIFPISGVFHGCYRGNRVASGVLGTMLTYHRLKGTWLNRVSCYIALTEFARTKFIQMGLPPEKIVVKPNFAKPKAQGASDGGFALFVGRLSTEKGIEVLLQAWRQMAGQVELKIVGNGPLLDVVEEATRENLGITYLGSKPHDQVLELMQQAAFLVMPSICYENFPLTIAEAYACGLPVIASDLGAMASLIHPGRTGLLFRPGNAQDLAKNVQMLLHNPAQRMSMRQAARAEYESKYTAEQNYTKLIEIYRQAQTSSEIRRY